MHARTLLLLALTWTLGCPTSTDEDAPPAATDAATDAAAPDAAGAADATDPSDAQPPPQDSKPRVEDTAPPPKDEGPPPQDIPDEGPPPQDDGPPQDIPDAGPPPQDEGPPPQDIPDAGPPPLDEGPPPQDIPDAGPTPEDIADAGPAPDPADTSAAIQLVLDGQTDIDIAGAWVTVVVPDSVGLGPAFLVQAEQDGPALLVQMDPTGLVAIGDRITLTVTEVDSSAAKVNVASAFEGLAVLASDEELAGLTQDLSDTASIVSGASAFEGELMQVSGTLQANLSNQSDGHAAGRFETSAFNGGGEVQAELRLRAPQDVAASLPGLTAGCAFTATHGFLWRKGAHVYASVYDAGAVAIGDCPAPELLSAEATSPTTVVAWFNRPLDAATALQSAFAITPGLTVEAVALDGAKLTLTTSAQAVDTLLTLTVAESVTDAAGTPMVSDALSVSFASYAPTAELLVTELNAKLSGGCGLVELTAIAGGTTKGVSIHAHANIGGALPPFYLAAGELIVLHFGDGDCNPTGAVDETSSPADQPSAEHPENFDTAYDLYDTNSLPSGDLVFYLKDADKAILDGVVTSDGNDDTWGGLEDDLDKMVDADEWLAPDGTSLQGTTYTDEGYTAHAVATAGGSTVDGTSLQRFAGLDTNSSYDWTSAPGTFGATNADAPAP